VLTFEPQHVEPVMVTPRRAVESFNNAASRERRVVSNDQLTAASFPFPGDEFRRRVKIVKIRYRKSIQPRGFQQTIVERFGRAGADLDRLRGMLAGMANVDNKCLAQDVARGLDGSALEQMFQFPAESFIGSGLQFNNEASVTAQSLPHTADLQN
jgi:hypothetical protein